MYVGCAYISEIPSTVVGKSKAIMIKNITLPYAIKYFTFHRIAELNVKMIWFYFSGVSLIRLSNVSDLMLTF